MALIRNGKQPTEIYRDGKQVHQVYRNGKLVWYRYFPVGYQIKIGTHETGYNEYGYLSSPPRYSTGQDMEFGVNVIFNDNIADKLSLDSKVKVMYATSRYTSNPTNPDGNSRYYAKEPIPVSFIRSDNSSLSDKITWYLDENYNNYFRSAQISKVGVNVDGGKTANNFVFSFDVDDYHATDDEIGEYDYVVLTIV